VQRLQYLTQHALVQLDEKNPMSSIRNTLSRSEHLGDSAQVCHTPGGGARPGEVGGNHQRNQDNQGSHGNREGQQSACGNVDQEVQQPPRLPCSQHNARPQAEAQPKANLKNAPMADLRRDRPGRYHIADDSDRFPAFTSNVTDHLYPKDFKPVGIPKYDSKQDPRQWICCYSVAIEVSGGSNSTKALYFLIALE
jgi:hypothetical protein